MTTDLFIDHSDHQNCDTWRSQQENLRPYEHSWKHTSHDLSPALNRKLIVSSENTLKEAMKRDRVLTEPSWIPSLAVWI